MRRDRIVEQRRAGAIASHAVAQKNGSDRDAGIDLAVERDHPDRSRVPAARVLFQILHGLRGPFLGRSDHGDGPHMGEERVERIEALGEPAFHVVDGMEHAGVGFDQAAADDPDGSGHAHARLVIAIHVGAHGQFGLFLE